MIDSSQFSLLKIPAIFEMRLQSKICIDIFDMVLHVKVSESK